MISEKMDAVTEFSEKFGFKVEKYMVAGASKVNTKKYKKL
jgi:hypothetical protein